MNSFSLSYGKDKGGAYKIFPERVKTSGGEYFDINADFRNILKIIRLNSDTEALDKDKAELTLKWFYGDILPRNLAEAFNLLNEFIRYPDGETGGKHIRQFDYEFDAEEIYASFIMDYHIDLIEVGFLHWYKFKILLQNLSSESPFAAKIRLRFMDLKDYKGEAYFKLRKAKMSVQLPKRLTPEEALAMAEMMEKLK